MKIEEDRLNLIEQMALSVSARQSAGSIGYYSLDHHYDDVLRLVGMARAALAWRDAKCRFLVFGCTRDDMVSSEAQLLRAIGCDGTINADVEFCKRLRRIALAKIKP